MQISSNYRAQALTSLRRETQTALSGKLSEGNSSGSSGSNSFTASISLGAGHSGLQSMLAETSLSTSGKSKEVEQKNAAGQTLNNVIESGRVINPADWLASSDLDLFHQVTGGTIKDGVIYDSNGNEDTSEKSINLVSALYDMRNYGTFDSQGNKVDISGSISANDLQQYINHYKNGGWISSDLGVLDDAMTALTQQEV